MRLLPKSWTLEEFSEDCERGFSLTLRTPWEYDPHCPHNLVNFAWRGKSWWWRTPEYIKPRKKWVECSGDAYWEQRGGGYWDHIQRIYGLSAVGEDSVHVYYGIYPMSWSNKDPKNSDHVWVWNYPWKRMEMVRHEVFSCDSTQKWDAHRRSFREPDTTEWGREQSKVYEIADRHEAWNYDPFPNVYHRTLYVDPYDRAVIPTKMYIEEREWWVGESWPWKALRLIQKPFIRRCLSIEFKEETGSRKGSWKGGTLGTGIDMLPGESLLSAWERFVAQEKEKYAKRGRRGD